MGLDAKDLHLAGSVGNAMTLEFVAGVPNLLTYVNLAGDDT